MRKAPNMGKIMLTIIMCYREILAQSNVFHEKENVERTRSIEVENEHFICTKTHIRSIWYACYLSMKQTKQNAKCFDMQINCDSTSIDGAPIQVYDAEVLNAHSEIFQYCLWLISRERVLGRRLSLNRVHTMEVFISRGCVQVQIVGSSTYNEMNFYQNWSPLYDIQIAFCDKHSDEERL